MDSHKKLEFVAKMTKMGLQHFDGGGVISAGNAGLPGGIGGALTVQNPYQASAPTSAATIGQQQSQLAGQLGTEAAGGGPNPAQTQYLQNAQQIAQQQAALNAQNRALNPGQAARLSSQAAVAAGQQAAGGAAAQQAQQQLAAQQQMAGLTGIEQQGLNTAQGINAQVMQNNANAVQNTWGGILGGVGGAVGSLFAKGGEVRKMASGGSIQTAGVPTFGNAQDLNPIQFSNPMAGKSFGGPSNFGAPQLTEPGVGSSSGLGTAMTPGLEGATQTSAAPGLGGAGMASQLGAAPDIVAGGGTSAGILQLAPEAADLHSGGMAHLRTPDQKKYARGGMVPQSRAADPRTTMAAYMDGGPVSGVGSMPSAGYANGGGVSGPQSRVGQLLTMKKGGAVKAKPKSDDVPAMVSPGEVYLSPEKAKAVAEGKANPMKIGEKIPGKAKVKGDSLKNDTVPKMLKDGGMVIPRHIMNSGKMAPEKAAEFVRQHMAKRKLA